MMIFKVMFEYLIRIGWKKGKEVATFSLVMHDYLIRSDYFNWR